MEHMTKPLNAQWLDSDLIPRLLEISKNFKIFTAILLNVKNDRRIFGASAYSRFEISLYEILKLARGATTLQNHFFQKNVFHRDKMAIKCLKFSEISNNLGIRSESSQCETFFDGIII